MYRMVLVKDYLVIQAWCLSAEHIGLSVEGSHLR